MLPRPDGAISDGLFSPFEDVASHSTLQPMCDTEIGEFFRDIDKDGDGSITFDELADKLAEIYEDLAPEVEQKFVRNPARRRLLNDKYLPIYEEATVEPHPEREGLRAFLAAMLPESNSSLNIEEFTKQVRTWNVPSQTHNFMGPAQPLAPGYRMHWWRKASAWTSVHGPRALFLTLVTILILALAVWQGIMFYNRPNARAALSDVVILTRFTAGALWPTSFLLLISMSRWTATFLRRYYRVSRLINWDRSESFHMRTAWLGLGLATAHGVGHLSGTFTAGSNPARREAVDAQFGWGTRQMTYLDFVRLIPGWTGITALGIFWVVALMSLPAVRRRNYELFQLAHLLMFPWIALMCVHGIMKLVQYPMMGLWIMVPTLLIIVERGNRLIRSFRHLPALVKTLDKDTITVTIKHPKGINWPNYHAGQYVLLQVPELSFWQWHPITISSSVGDELQLIIKTEGNWTSSLRELARSRLQMVHVGLDGPFGAPTQRFYEFDRSLIIGSGVGVTPFSAILTDMESNIVQQRDPWSQFRHRRHFSHDPNPVEIERDARPLVSNRRFACSPARGISPMSSYHYNPRYSTPSLMRSLIQTPPVSRPGSRQGSVVSLRDSLFDHKPSHSHTLSQSSLDTLELAELDSRPLPSLPQTRRDSTQPLLHSRKHSAQQASHTRNDSGFSWRSDAKPPQYASHHDFALDAGPSTAPLPLPRGRARERPHGRTASMPLNLLRPSYHRRQSSKSHTLQRASTFSRHTHADDLLPSRRRVDFHWLVRDRNSLRWLASLLNRVHDLSSSLDRETLELNVTTHITARKKNISEYVFRYLLDAYRTKSSAVSALTGLKARSAFGRPDLVGILNGYYRDEVARMKLEGTWGRGQRVGVFFCGNSDVGRVLADACAELTRAGRADGSKVRFVFMMEVFL